MSFDRLKRCRPISSGLLQRTVLVLAISGLLLASVARVTRTEDDVIWVTRGATVQENVQIWALYLVSVGVVIAIWWGLEEALRRLESLS